MELCEGQRYKIGIDWDINGKLFLGGKDKKIASSMKTNDFGQWTIAPFKISTDEQKKTDQNYI